MAQDKTPTFVLTTKIITDKQDEKLIEKGLEIHRVIYNTCLGELLKQERKVKQIKRYKRARRQLNAISIKLSVAEKAKDKEEIKRLEKEKREIAITIAKMRQEFGLIEYSLHEYMKPIRFHFGNAVNSAFAQKTASRAWNALSRKLKGEAKRVYFKRNGEMGSFEGKTNKTGWKYRKRKIEYGKHLFELKIDPKDMYLWEALYWIENGQTYTYRYSKGEEKTGTYRVKYMRILKEFIRGRSGRRAECRSL